MPKVSKPINHQPFLSQGKPLTINRYIFFLFFFVLSLFTIHSSLFTKEAHAQAAGACTFIPSTVAVGETITVTSLNDLTGEIRIAGAFWPQLPDGPDTGSVFLGNLAANATTQTLPISGTSSGTSPLPITAGSYAVRVGGYGVLCTAAGGGTSLAVTAAGGGGGGGGGGSGTTCSGTNLGKEPVDNFNRVSIKANIFDDKIFNANQLFATTDNIYMLLSGCSSIHSETDQITMGTGALAASGKLVTAMYGTPPVSGVQYFAHQFQKFNPVKEAYAQEGGIGYSALQPVVKIWEAFRNISYVGFTIVFIVIGFMIMFRSRISPQAVATVQDSLPRIVIALILVTFSYAIAGLMIDIMFVFLNVVISALKGTGLLNDNADNVFKKSVFGLVFASWNDIFEVVRVSLSSIIGKTVDLGKIGDLLGFGGGLIGAIVVGIAMLYVMFKVFFMLLVAYATIILLTMSAPFFFLFQALPGNNGAKEWFKQMAANVSVFPVTALMFLFAAILGNLPDLGSTGQGIASGAEIGQFPLLAGDIDPKAISGLIAMGFLLMTPTAADMVKKAIGAQGGVGAGAGAAMASLGAGAAVAGAGARRGYQTAQEHLPQQIGPQGSIAGKFKYINPAYYRANSQVAQEKRADKIKGEAGTSLADQIRKSNEPKKPPKN